MSAYQAKVVYGTASSVPGGKRLDARKRTSSIPRRFDRKNERVPPTRGWGRNDGGLGPDGQQGTSGTAERPLRPSSGAPSSAPGPPSVPHVSAAVTERRPVKPSEPAGEPRPNILSRDSREAARPPRPTTPCMNRGDGVRRKRISSAGRPSASRPSSSSVGIRMFQLESRLLGEHRSSTEAGSAPEAEKRQVRPASSSSRAHGGRISSKLIEEAVEMCRNSQTAGSSSAATVSSEHGMEVPPAAASPPPDQLERPNAPTPEQTNHWLQGMEASQGGSGSVPFAAQVTCISPRDETAQMRPRSPTPTKMLAWGEEDTPSASCSSRALYFSPSDDDDPFGRGDHSDGLIHRLIEACQMDDVRRAFGIYERLRRLRVPLYEGVYKLIIECCMRNHQLGHGIQFYETLKSSGQRVSSRIVIVLIEACAREQHSEKVHALWQDWCQPHEDLRPCHREVLMVTLAALVRTLSPDLALELLRDAKERFEDPTWVLHVEAEVQELLQLLALAASEAQQSGNQLGGSLASYHDLQALLLQLLDDADVRGAGDLTMRRPHHGTQQSGREKERPMEDLCDDELLMEDVDLDLELAAM